LQRAFQQQLKTTVNATNEDDIHNEHLCNSPRKELEEIIGLSEDSLLCGIGQQEFKIVPDVSLKTGDNFETNYRQEVATSSDKFETKYEEEEATSGDNEGQDFKMSHLTLEQLEQRFKNNVKYLRDILKDEKYCWCHEQLKKVALPQEISTMLLLKFPTQIHRSLVVTLARNLL
jgi:hypothetical protein